MAKKKKQKEQLPGGMSRRQAKLAARAAERAALEREPRPYAGLALEPQLVALQEFVPSAVMQVEVEGVDQPVTTCTVLPGAVAALVREEAAGGQAFVALQMARRSPTPGKDLAHALRWLASAKPGETLNSISLTGDEPQLTDLLSADQTAQVQAFQDFAWWLPEGATVDNQVQASLKAANDTVMPSYPVPAPNGAAWWVDAGEKAHIRWVRTEDEEQLLRALARIGAAGELNLGEGTKFAGAFRTHGVAVPVFDLDPNKPRESFEAGLATLDENIAAALAEDAPLDASARRALENIKSRQVTLR